MNLLDFLALALAGGALVDVWFNGSLFANWLAFMQVKAQGPPPVDATPPGDAAESNEVAVEEPLPRLMRFADRVLPRLAAELLSCPDCLAHHTPAVIACGCLVPALFLDQPWADLFKLPMYALAATRLGFILNGFLPEHLRYQRFKDK